MKKKLVIVLLSMMLILTWGCGGETKKSNNEKAKISIAYQYGVAHCPAVICKEKSYIEDAYKEATGKEIEVEWVQMSSGADINTAMAAGEIQAGFMGVPVAVTGIMSGVGYKIFTNESGVSQSFMTNDDSIQSLKDIEGSANQIALVNIGSANHIALGMALVSEGLDAHSLDSNLVAMKYPDGMAAIVTGAVACHVATEPYLTQERKESNLHEIPSLNNAWSKTDSFNVGIASEELYESNKEVYDALVAGVEKAINFINEDSDGAAEIVSKYDGNSKEDDKICLENSTFSVKTKNLYSIATFMAENGFLDNKPDSYQSLVFDNVEGD